MMQVSVDQIFWVLYNVKLQTEPGYEIKLFDN